MGKYYSMMNKLIKCEITEQVIELKMIAQKESALLKISSEITTQFQLENVSVPFAKMKEMTNMIAKAYPIQSACVFDEKMILKLNTRIMLKIVTSETMPKSATCPSGLTDLDVMYTLT